MQAPICQYIILFPSLLQKRRPFRAHIGGLLSAQLFYESSTLRADGTRIFVRILTEADTVRSAPP